jgi:CBS domain-containing protein
VVAQTAEGTADGSVTMMTAEEIMTKRPVTVVDESATLDQALRLMSEHEIRHLPVLRGEEVVGMLSDRDLRSLGLSMAEDPASLERLAARLRMRVQDLMTGDVISVGPATDVAEIIDLMLEEKVSALPVIDADESELLGIVSYVDVLRAVQDELQ